MRDFKAELSDYVKASRHVELAREILYSGITSAFGEELKILNSKLPKGYLINSYHVYLPSQGRSGGIELSPPTKDGVAIKQDELPNLDSLLREEFERIERESGIPVHWGDV